MKQGHSKALESQVNEDFDISSEEGVKLSEPQNNLSFKDNHVPMTIVPIGPRFQAKVLK